MKKLQKLPANYDFFIKTDTSSYKGEWIAITGKKIIYHGKDAQEVYRKAKQKYPTANVSLAKVPDEQILILRFSQ
ncbi:succinyl-CoA synthetase subunit alpha [Candidatus Gottesmanbacteria bacterium]|nr:succinyl-CoA synthetase subunit alpha [Candidatus Gottesmanbacteria bacterium]